MRQAFVIMVVVAALVGGATYLYGPGAGLLCAVAALLGAWWWISVEERW